MTHQPMRARLASIPKTKRHDDGIQRDVKDPEKARQDYIDRLDAVPHVAALQRVVDGVWTQEQYDEWCDDRRKFRTALPPLKQRNGFLDAFKDDDDREKREREAELRLIKERKQQEARELKREWWRERERRRKDESNKKQRDRRLAKRNARMERIFGSEYARKRAEGRMA